MRTSSRTVVILALGFTLGAACGTASHAQPVDQSTRSLAGLVIQFGDGSVRELCVDLGGAERSGIELLRLSGLSVISEDSVLGSMVCRIGGEGCDFPAEKCDCECQDLANCTYWAYYTSRGGAWDYAAVGPAARTVRHGDVDGWAWGRGTVSSGAKPPWRSFETLCAAALAPTATRAPVQTANVPTATVAAPPTAARPIPTPTPRRTATRAPTDDPRSGATARPSATAPASGTPRGMATVTADDSAIASSMYDEINANRQATLALLPTALAAFATTQAEVAATMQAQGTAQGEPAREPQTSGVDPSVTPMNEPRADVTLVAVRPFSTRDAANRTPSGGTAARDGEAEEDAGSLSGYLVVVLMLVLLGGTLVWLRR